MGESYRVVVHRDPTPWKLTILSWQNFVYRLDIPKKEKFVPVGFTRFLFLKNSVILWVNRVVFPVKTIFFQQL